MVLLTHRLVAVQGPVENMQPPFRADVEEADLPELRKPGCWSILPTSLQPTRQGTCQHSGWVRGGAKEPVSSLEKPLSYGCFAYRPEEEGERVRGEEGVA